MNTVAVGQMRGISEWDLGHSGALWKKTVKHKAIHPIYVSAP